MSPRYGGGKRIHILAAIDRHGPYPHSSGMGSLVARMRENLARLRGDLSQERFAELLGCKQSQISFYLSGRRGWHQVGEWEERLERAGIDPLELVADPSGAAADPVDRQIASMLPKADPVLKDAILLLLRREEGGTVRAPVSPAPTQSARARHASDSDR